MCIFHTSDNLNIFQLKPVIKIKSLALQGSDWSQCKNKKYTKIPSTQRHISHVTLECNTRTKVELFCKFICILCTLISDLCKRAELFI